MLKARLFTNNRTRISNKNLSCVRFYIELVFQFVSKRFGCQEEERIWKRKIREKISSEDGTERDKLIIM